MTATHRSHVTALRDCMTRRTLLGTGDPHNIGHLQYLEGIGCGSDARVVKKLLKAMAGAKYNYVIDPPSAGFDINTQSEFQKHLNTFAKPLRARFNDDRTLRTTHYNYTISTQISYKTIYKMESDPQFELFDDDQDMYDFLVIVSADFRNKRYILQPFLNAPLNPFLNAPATKGTSVGAPPQQCRWVCCRDCTAINFDGIATSKIVKDRDKIKGEFNDVLQELYGYLACTAFIELHRLLDMPAVYRQSNHITQAGAVIEPPDPTNKKTAKHREFIRLYKPAVRTISDNSQPSEPTGVKRKEHVRSGHYRTLRSGKRVWVRAHRAGDPALGSTVNLKRTIEVVDDEKFN